MISALTKASKHWYNEVPDDRLVGRGRERYMKAL